MEVHHLIAERHTLHTKNKCIACNEDLNRDEWTSKHVGEFHYKKINCSRCGYENTLKVDFIGSGHDNWHKRGVSTIEDRIRIVEGK